MLIRIDDAISVPRGAQIGVQIRRSIATGELEPCERLPPARGLAGDLDVNLRTVLRAYRMLRAEGLIEMRPGRRTRVSAQPSPMFMELTALIEASLLKAADVGLDRPQFMDIMASYYAQMNSTPRPS